MTAYVNTVWLCLDWFDSVVSCSGPKIFEVVQADGFHQRKECVTNGALVTSFFPGNSNLIMLMAGKAEWTGQL